MTRLRALMAVLLAATCACGGNDTGGRDASNDAASGNDAAASADADGSNDADHDDAALVDSAITDASDATLEDAADASIADAAADASDAGTGASDASSPDAGGGGVIIDDPALPLIHDFTGASSARVLALVRAALNGLGFDASSNEGPNHDDRVFVGRHYLAWIDQTGFYGKINGLWTLNAAAGDALDFVLKEPDGRPVNLFIPGEDGDGRWPASYKGGEHVEFPSRVPEANDNPSCANGDWCNQYGLNEAVHYTNPSIPWWSICNAGSMSFGTKIDPITVEEIPGGIRLVYEGRLVKEADGDGTPDGDACHADYLFPDGVRRAVFLRVGYELHTDQDYFDRTMQIRNPVGNPSFAGAMSLIGGFVMTEWPNTHYLKRLNRFWRPEQSDTSVQWSGNVPLLADVFNDLSGRAPVANDVLVAWIAQPLTLAARAGYHAGIAVTLSHEGSIDNDDVGACLCSVHGGLEMGGGLVHANISLPIDGGESTALARRRLSVPSVGAPPVVHGFVFEAESSNALGHNVGRADGDGWSANTAADASGHMSYGPYATNWGGGSAQAAFYLLVDNNSADDGKVVTLDVYDVTAGQVIATREVRRRQFRHPSAYQRFGLDFNLDGRAGHSLEVRVYWHDISYVRLDKIVVSAAD